MVSLGDAVVAIKPQGGNVDMDTWTHIDFGINTDLFLIKS